MNKDKYIKESDLFKAMENNSHMVEVFGKKRKMIDGMLLTYDIAEFERLDIEQIRAKAIDEIAKQMKGFIENLVSRLEELPTIAINRYKGGAFGNYVGTNHYIDKRKTIDAINELAEEFATDTNVGNKDGWIPCSERLPETNESVLCQAKSTARGGDVCFVGSCHNGFWFLQSSADTHSFPGQYKVVAWQPLPQLYQEEGGTNE